MNKNALVDLTFRVPVEMMDNQDLKELSRAITQVLNGEKPFRREFGVSLSQALASGPIDPRSVDEGQLLVLNKQSVIPPIVTKPSMIVPPAGEVHEERGNLRNLLDQWEIMRHERKNYIAVMVQAAASSDEDDLLIGIFKLKDIWTPPGQRMRLGLEELFYFTHHERWTGEDIRIYVIRPARINSSSIPGINATFFSKTLIAWWGDRLFIAGTLYEKTIDQQESPPTPSDQLEPVAVAPRARKRVSEIKTPEESEDDDGEYLDRMIANFPKRGTSALTSPSEEDDD